MTDKTLSDHDWNMLDDLCRELGVGAGNPVGGWFQILPEQILAVESLLERLGCEDDRTDRITRLQDLLRRIHTDVDAGNVDLGLMVEIDEAIGIANTSE